MPDERERVPQLIPMPAQPAREDRRAFTLSREVNRETGEIRGLGLRTPEAPGDAF